MTKHYRRVFLGILSRSVHCMSRENRPHVETAFGHAFACASNSVQYRCVRKVHKHPNSERSFDFERATARMEQAVTRRRPTGAPGFEAAKHVVFRNPGVSHASSEVTMLATASDATNQPAIPNDPVLAFNSVDERFIDFLVEEALNEWRAKNF